MTVTSTRIAFGDAEFTDEDIKSATVIEELSPYSITVPVSTLELTIHSTDSDFSIVNPAGDFADLINRQPMAVYESVDGLESYIGQFYLDKWSSPTETIKKLSCVDIIGIADKFDYYGGLSITPTTAGSIIANIMSELGIDYEINPDVAATELTGWIPICSYREALQQVLFACSAFILTGRRPVPVIGYLSGDDTITRGIGSGVAKAGQSRIWQKRWRVSQWSGTEPTLPLPRSQQSKSQLSLRPQVTGVEIVSHNISEGTGLLTLFSGSLTAGLHEIRFKQPMHDLVATGATVDTTHPNYCILSVASPGTVTLTGEVYVDATRTFGIYTPVAGQDNILRVTDATMVSDSNANSVAQQLSDYYAKRYVQTFRMFAPVAKIGDSVDAESLYASTIHGFIEKVSTDLTNGDVSNVELVGTVL